MFKQMQACVVAVALVSLGLGGCLLNKEPSLGERLMKRAAFDLRCRASRLQYHKLSKKTYGVSGCGRRGTYLLVCRYTGTRYDSEQECRWVMNNALSR